MWKDIFQACQRYMGSGLLLIFFVAAWIYLFINEKERLQRIFFVYIPLIVFLLFFNPLFFKIFSIIDVTEVYFRNLWLVPFTIVLSYTVVKIYTKIREPAKRWLFLGIVLILTAVGGRCVYSSPLYQRAENLYHMPDSVVHICDAIEIEGREVTAVFPLEMLLYVRQYSAVVCMPYGRDIIMENWASGVTENKLFKAMESEAPDAQVLGKLARDEMCVYIVLSEEKKLQGNLEEQGYAVFDKIDGYVIYKDMDFEPFVF